MSVARSPENVIERLPEWRGASWKELEGGLTNRAWKLEKAGRKAVLKIDDEPRKPPYNARPGEAAVQSVAARAGLAGRVLFADKQVYLTEYIEGTVWEANSLDEGDNIEQVAVALRRLHSLPLSGRSFDAKVAAKRYAQKIDSPDKKLVAECVDITRRMRLPHNLCCCHNDLVAENIIATPELRFLDWEYACDNDPLFDLATIIEHHELDEEHSQLLLHAYFDGSGEHWRPKLALQQRLYLALLWLWLASRPDSSRQDLDAVARRLTTSCS